MTTPAESANLPSDIRIITKSVVPTDKSLPTLALQVICLVNSYMVWVGVASSPNEEARVTVNHGNLCRDWACGMPAISVCPTVSTKLTQKNSLINILPHASPISLLHRPHCSVLQEMTLPYPCRSA